MCTLTLLVNSLHYHSNQTDSNGTSNIHRSVSASSSVEDQSGGLDQPNAPGAIDNPDQRIGEDIATFTANCVGMWSICYTTYTANCVGMYSVRYYG
jgi:hypothetical protein